MPEQRKDAPPGRDGAIFIRNYEVAPAVKHYEVSTQDYRGSGRKHVSNPPGIVQEAGCALEAKVQRSTERSKL